MDTHFFTRHALEDLVQPLQVGSLLPGGGRLKSARISNDYNKIVYTISPDLDMVVQAPSSKQPALARTRHLSIWLDRKSSTKLPLSQQTMLTTLIARIRENDTLSPRFLTTQANHILRQTVSLSKKNLARIHRPKTSTLYLLPGHIADNMDLGLRTLGILTEIKNIFIETGSSEDLMKILQRYSIPVNGKRVFSVDWSEPRVRSALRHLRAIAARQEDICFFGACEGAPTFCDPGKSIIQLAAQLRPPLRIRVVGGPSALSAALMRAEERIDRFIFLGVGGSLRDMQDFAPQIATALQSGLPAIFFIAPTLAASDLAWLQKSCRVPSKKITLYCDLTSPDELITHHSSWKETAQAYSRLAKGTRVVLIVTPPGIHE